jgi:hypothetical protein
MIKSSKCKFPPLLDLRLFILCHIWPSTHNLEFLEFFKHFTHLFYKTHQSPYWSSIYVTKYCDPPKDFFCIVPHKCKCTNSSNWILLFPLLVQNLVFHHYPCKKMLHKFISSGLVFVLKPCPKKISCGCKHDNMSCTWLLLGEIFFNLFF